MTYFTLFQAGQANYEFEKIVARLADTPGVGVTPVLPGHFDKQPTHALGHETYWAPSALQVARAVAVPFGPLWDCLFWSRVSRLIFLRSLQSRRT